LIDWSPVAELLDPLYPAAKGEPAWPPLAMVKALLLSIWYDLSDVKLAEALDDRASFRRFCGVSAQEATPERTAFVRFRRLLVAHELGRLLFETVTMQLKSKAVTVKTGTLVDATIIASACGAGSKRSSGHGSATTACAECDGKVSPKPPSKSTSPPSPTTSSAP
jgi:IS5 family transposase